MLDGFLQKYDLQLLTGPYCYAKVMLQSFCLLLHASLNDYKILDVIICACCDQNA